MKYTVKLMISLRCNGCQEEMWVSCEVDVDDRFTLHDFNAQHKALLEEFKSELFESEKWRPGRFGKMFCADCAVEEEDDF